MPNNNPHKQHLQHLIAQGKLAIAIEELLAATQQNGQTDLHNDIISLSARFNRNEKGQRLGILSTSEYNIENNRITQALLTLLDEYQESVQHQDTENRAVIFDPPENILPTPQPFPMHYENGYALLIGIKYGHWKKKYQLDGTLNDIRDLHAHFIHPQKAAYKPENVIPLTESQATRQGIFQALETLAQKANQDKDASVIVYYSGHGETDGKNHFLVPYDFDLQQWHSNKTFDADKVVLSKDFTKALDKITAKKCLIILDCCHSADMPADRSLQLSPVFLDNFLADIPTSEITERGIGGQIAQGKGRVILTSCQGEEKSLDIGSNGLFTQVLLESLNGTENIEKDGWVRLIDLIRYVPKNVKTRALQYSRDQNPVFKSIQDLGAEEFVICAYNIGKAKGLGEEKQINTTTLPLEPSQVETFKKELHTLLNENQQNAIADILEKIKNTRYTYDKVKYKEIENMLNPITLAMMAQSLVQSTKVLINSLK